MAARTAATVSLPVRVNSKSLVWKFFTFLSWNTLLLCLRQLESHQLFLTRAGQSKHWESLIHVIFHVLVFFKFCVVTWLCGFCSIMEKNKQINTSSCVHDFKSHVCLDTFDFSKDDFKQKGEKHFIIQQQRYKSVATPGGQSCHQLKISHL